MTRPTAGRCRLTVVLGAAVCGLLAALGGAASAAAQDFEVLTEISDARLVELLTEFGVDGVKKLDENDTESEFEVRINGFAATLRNRRRHKDWLISRIQTSEQGMTDAKLAAANEWNRSHLYSAAYLDDVADWVLKSDLDMQGGVSKETIKAWLTRFGREIADFQKMAVRVEEG